MQDVLKEKMKHEKVTVDMLVEHMQINRSTFYRKRKTGNKSFTVEEIVKIAEYLQLSMREIGQCFFEDYLNKE